MRLLFLVFLFPSLLCSAQKSGLIWPENIIESANTANNEPGLTSDEKQVIFYVNLVRLDPKLFSETYLKKYLDSTRTKNSYTKSLKQTLENSASMDALEPKNDLHKIAKTHAVKYGKEGKTGHGNFDERFKEVESKYQHSVGENCDYGSNSPLETVMRLLIDDGVRSLGHRKNILNPQYNSIGVSIQPHKRYGSNCVMDLGG
jgi:hypothetical protein